MRSRVTVLGASPIANQISLEDLEKLDTQNSTTEVQTEPEFNPGPLPDLPENPLIEVDYNAYGALGPFPYFDLWVDADKNTARKEILQFDPDIVFTHSYRSGPPIFETGIGSKSTEYGLLNRRYNLPGGSGGHFHMTVYSDVYQDWYESLPEERKFTHPDGSLVDHPEEIAGKDIYGNQWGNENFIIPSLFSDNTFEFWARKMKQDYKLGINQFWIDGFGILLSGPLDFSHWATNKFQNYLESLPSDRLDELGISNPGDFEIYDYLAENDLTPSNSGIPTRDAVFQEYAHFQSQSFKQFINDLFTDTRESLAPEVVDAGTAMYGNHFSLQPHALRPQAFYLSDVVDHIQMEIGDPALPPVLPPREHPMAIKTARAAARFEKPVRVYSTFGGREHENPEQHGLDPSEYYPTLMKFEAAQAYAHGATAIARMMHRLKFEDMINTWMKPDGSVADTLHDFIDFVRSHRRFLADANEANNAVIALSLPTIFWLDVSWGQPEGSPRTAGVPGVGAALRREHIPYDVRILDYPPLWEAPKQTADLTDFDLIVLPNVTCLSDSHVDAIETALENGSTVIATGGAPTRTESFDARDDIQTVLQNSENAEIIDGHPEMDGIGGAAPELRDAVPTENRQIELGTDGDVSVSVFEQSDPDRLIVHLLNYEYDPESDSMLEKTDLDVTVRDISVEPNVARYYSRKGSTDLTIDTLSDGVSVTVSELDIWGFIVFADSEQALKPETPESTATERVSEVQTLVEDAQNKDRTELLHRAKGKLTSAESAIDYGAFDEAKRLADESVKWAEQAYQTPVIGLDTAHGQTDEWSDFVQNYEDVFERYQIKEVTEEWTESTFDEIDVFIFPQSTNSDSGFTSQELDAVEQYVHCCSPILRSSQPLSD